MLKWRNIDGGNRESATPKFNSERDNPTGIGIAVIVVTLVVFQANVWHDRTDDSRATNLRNDIVMEIQRLFNDMRGDWGDHSQRMDDIQDEMTRLNQSLQELKRLQSSIQGEVTRVNQSLQELRSDRIQSELTRISETLQETSRLLHRVQPSGGRGVRGSETELTLPAVSFQAKTRQTADASRTLMAAPASQNASDNA